MTTVTISSGTLHSQAALHGVSVVAFAQRTTESTPSCHHICEPGRPSKWETEHHFVSWLRLCPDNRISGAKVIGKGRLPTNNPISIALKIAASSLRLSDRYWGAQFRRLRIVLRWPLRPWRPSWPAWPTARCVYGIKYVDQAAAFYEAQHRHLQIRHLKFKAASIGYQLIQISAA